MIRILRRGMKSTINMYRLVTGGKDTIFAGWKIVNKQSVLIFPNVKCSVVSFFEKDDTNKLKLFYLFCF